jgi:hypothetical protein
VRAVLVAVNDERRAEFRGERRERAASLRALFERAWVVAKEKVDLAAAGWCVARTDYAATAQLGKDRPRQGEQLADSQRAEVDPRAVLGIGHKLSIAVRRRR